MKNLCVYLSKIKFFDLFFRTILLRFTFSDRTETSKLECTRVPACHKSSVKNRMRVDFFKKYFTICVKFPFKTPTSLRRGGLHCHNKCPRSKHKCSLRPVGHLLLTDHQYTTLGYTVYKLILSPKMPCTAASSIKTIISIVWQPRFPKS